MFSSKKYVTSYGSKAIVFLENESLWMENETDGPRKLDSTEIVDLTRLTQHLANPVVRDFISMNCYMYLCKTSDSSKISAHLNMRLLGGGPCMSTGKITVLRAVKTGNTRALAELIAEGAPLDKRDFNGFTPLWHAVYNDQIEAVRLLVDSGRAGLDLYVEAGGSALGWATVKNKIEIVRILLNAGANTDASILDGWTSYSLLDYAKKKNYTEIISLLMASKEEANIERKNRVIDMRLEKDQDSYKKLIGRLARVITAQLFEDIDDEDKKEVVETAILSFLKTSKTFKYGETDLPSDEKHITNRASFEAQLVTDLKAKKYLFKAKTINTDDLTEELNISAAKWSVNLAKEAEARAAAARPVANAGAGAMPPTSNIYRDAFLKGAGTEAGKQVAMTLFS